MPGTKSPKLRQAEDPEFQANYAVQNALVVRDFDAVGICARGGLSNFWGAVVNVFDDDDLGESPVSRSDLSAAYRAVAERIGISGTRDGDMAWTADSGIPLQAPLELSPLATALLDRYTRRRPHGLVLGRVHNAVLAEDEGERRHCNLQGTCAWGCDRNAIYNSAVEIDALSAHDTFTFRDNHLVEGIVAVNGGYVLQVRDRRSGALDDVPASSVVLAAGVMPTTRLVLQLQGRYDEEVPLVTTPSFAFAAVLPSRLGSALPSQSFGLAQLAFQAEFGPDSRDFATGLLYGADGVAAADLMARMPLSRRGAMTACRLLTSALLIGLVYLPGEYSRNMVCLERGAEPSADRLVVRGGNAEGCIAAVRRVVRRLRRTLFGLGAVVLPGSVEIQDPGADVHYGCTLPMGRDCTETGEVVGFPNLFVAGGATLSRLPPKHLTFSIMANAHRTGHSIAARRSAGSDIQ